MPYPPSLTTCCMSPNLLGERSPVKSGILLEPTLEVSLSKVYIKRFNCISVMQFNNHYDGTTTAAMNEMIQNDKFNLTFRINVRVNYSMK